MSSIIDIKSLNLLQQKKIKKDLTIIEKTQDFMGKSKTPIIITMYSVNEDVIHLPFAYSIFFFGKFLNDSIIFPTCDTQFLGKLRDYQIPLVNLALDQLQNTGTTTIAVYPGFGKTIVASYLSCFLKTKTVVIVNIRTLVKQWVNTFKNTTNARICIVDGSPKSKKLLSSDEIFDVYICMCLQVKNIVGKRRKEIGHVIFDEAHLLCTKTSVDSWLYFTPKYITVETATPERDDGFDKMIELVAGEHIIYRESTNPFNVKLFMTNIIPPTSLVNSKGELDKLNYQEMITCLNSMEVRNNMILKLVKENIQNKILILSKRIEHCNILKSLLSENNIQCDTLCGTKKEYEDGKVLIGTVSKIGTGFDQDSFCDIYDGIKFNFLIVACYIKKNNLLNQSIGRIFRANNPTVIQMLDLNSGFKTIWNKNLKWYRDRKADISLY